MESLEELNSELLKVDESIPQLKEKRREYLSTLGDVLDVYVMSIMEEENAIYNLLSQRSQYHFNLKPTSPFEFQLKVLMNLPFLQSDIQVETGEHGFVKLKLPNIEEGMMRSRLWTEACSQGIQKSLVRHLNQWKDDSNYLMQNAVIGWLADVVDYSLTLAGIIPNYLIKRQQTKNRVVLHMEDLAKGMRFTVELLPVLVFPTTQLPQQLAEIPLVSQNPSCNTWNVVCRPNETFDHHLWGVSLNQHEKLMIKEHNLKPVIHILKSLRDGCAWNILNDDHIRTLVLQAYVQDPTMFEIFTLAELLLQLLLKLRDKLVSRDGLSPLWDSNHNLFGGLNGLQKSGLARAVTKTRDSLQKLSDDYRTFFRLETYTIAPVSSISQEPSQSSQSSSTLPSFDTLESNTSGASAPQPGIEVDRRVSPSEEEAQNVTIPASTHPPSDAAAPREQPQRRVLSPQMTRIQRMLSSSDDHLLRRESSGGLAQVESGSHWWKTLTAVAVGVGAVAATVAIAINKNRNSNRN